MAVNVWPCCRSKIGVWRSVWFATLICSAKGTVCLIVVSCCSLWCAKGHVHQRQRMIWRNQPNLPRAFVSLLRIFVFGFRFNCLRISSQVPCQGVRGFVFNSADRPRIDRCPLSLYNALRGTRNLVKRNTIHQDRQINEWSTYRVVFWCTQRIVALWKIGSWCWYNSKWSFEFGDLGQEGTIVRDYVITMDH